MSDNKGRYVTTSSGAKFGCDPEFFVTTKAGKIVGGEKVIDDAGIPYTSRYDGSIISKGIVLDGVQLEINPSPYGCRANLGNEIATHMRNLKKKLESLKGEITTSFASVVEVDEEELKTLSDKARIMGCMPSENLHNARATINVDPENCRTRSAGGHIHIGWETAKEHPLELVQTMDVLVGLPSVLIDRDPKAKERRKMYGRAGEYRLPPHGVEYRTLSNYWMRSYQLMSFVMGMSRLSTQVIRSTFVGDAWSSSPSSRWDAYGELMKRVDPKAVVKAINTNSLTLAKKQWEGVEDFLATHVTSRDAGLDMTKLVDFKYFCEKVWDKGIEFWFPEDPFYHWCNMPEGHSRGWESFLVNKVAYMRNLESMRATNATSATTTDIEIPF